MSVPKEVDYIIVGQGIAGATLAFQLINRGKKILVIDKPETNTSSRIAAGLFNPITGKKMTKTWMADTLFSYLHHFYPEVETVAGHKFFYPMTLYRPFISIEEQNEWMGKSSDPVYSAYLEKIFSTKSMPFVNDDVGGLLLKQCGYVDTVAYLQAMQQFITAHGFFVHGFYDDALLTVGRSGIDYNGCKANKIIFCQGEQSTTNKWFSWLPIQPLKGETLRVTMPDFPQQIINRGVYVVPKSNSEWRVGSTYNFHDKERNVTAHAKLELEAKLQTLVTATFNVVGQDWGMRPTTPDRRPVMGAHPQCAAVIIFNGMGTKGVSLSPYFSDVLCQWLENETDLDKAVDVNRYKLLYSKSTK